MDSYARLSTRQPSEESPLLGSPTDANDLVSPPLIMLANGDENAREGLGARVQHWWRYSVWRQAPDPPPSGYLTLIPLSDSRLKPRQTTCLVSAAMLFAVVLAATVFVLVPRGLSPGDVHIKSDHMSWNTSKGTYQLNLLASVPVFNPNYLSATVEGSIRVYFYNTEAGATMIPPTKIPARAKPGVVQAIVDASNVPSDYALTILSECAAFPRELIFFLKGDLTAKYLGQKQDLSPIDTYFMIDCVNGQAIPRALTPTGPAARQTAEAASSRSSTVDSSGKGASNGYSNESPLAPGATQQEAAGSTAKQPAVPAAMDHRG